MSQIAFFDLEVNPQTGKILDIGAINADDVPFHENYVYEFVNYIKDSEFICGHNILAHDLKYIRTITGNTEFGQSNAIDTLLLSPLFFPKNPYHRLLKDDKLQS